MAKNKATRTHNDIPWLKVKEAWNRGDSYEKMGNRFGKLAADGDRTKPMRAIISRGLTMGFTNPTTGKPEKLQPREGMRAHGVGKKAPKAKVAKVAKTAKTAGKVGRPRKQGKAILIESEGDGKLIRFEADQKVNLVPVTKLMPSLVNVLDKAGFSVTPKPPEQPTAAAPVEAAPVPEPQPVVEQQPAA